MEKKPKTHRWNRWEKEEEKLRKLREKLQQKQEQQPQPKQDLGHASERKPQEQQPQPREWEPKNLNREVIARLVAWHLREEEKLKKLAEEIAQRVIIRMLPEITELVISKMVKVIQEAVVKGGKVEIRGLATWRTKNGRIKVKNHIKPKQPNQP